MNLLNRLRDRVDQLEERERKLLLVFGGVVGFMILFLAPLALSLSVGSQRTENERVLQIIQEIRDERVTLGRRKAESARVTQRYARQAPALAGFLAQIADREGVDIPETQDRSTVPHGKTVKERVTKIQIRKVGMLALSNFMAKIESSGYAVSISRLIIRKRGAQPDEYDAEMEVSAFDREEPKKKPEPSAEKDESEGEGEE